MQAPVDTASLDEESSPRGRVVLQLPFGLFEGRLYEPLQVARGLQCGCVCPACGAPLVAKHAPAGKVRPHFAHASAANCARGFESAVHLAAKQLISERRLLFIPSHVATASACCATGTFERSEVLYGGGVAQLQGVRIEHTLGPIRPDLVVDVGDQPFLIEIACTHFVDGPKSARIRELGLCAIEIDVSDLRELGFAVLARRLFEPNGHAKWLHHPKTVSCMVELEVQLKAKVEAEDRAWEARQARRRMQYAAEAEEKARRLAAPKEAKARLLRADDKLAAKFARLSDPEKLQVALRAMGVEGGVRHDFLNRHVRAARAIRSPERVWQTAMFAALVHRKSQRTGDLISVEDVVAWLPARFEVDRSRGKPEVAVWDFLQHLAERQILEWQRKKGFLVTVAGLVGAEALDTDHALGGRGSLAWRETPPPRELLARLASAFELLHGSRPSWRGLALTALRERHEDPVDAMLHLAGQGVAPAATRRFFLAAGFAWPVASG